MILLCNNEWKWEIWKSRRSSGAILTLLKILRPFSRKSRKSRKRLPTRTKFGKILIKSSAQCSAQLSVFSYRPIQSHGWQEERVREFTERVNWERWQMINGQSKWGLTTTEYFSGPLMNFGTWRWSALSTARVSKRIAKNWQSWQKQ